MRATSVFFVSRRVLVLSKWCFIPSLSKAGTIACNFTGRWPNPAMLRTDTSLVGCVVPKSSIFNLFLGPGTVLNGSYAHPQHPHCQSQDDVMGRWNSKESKKKERRLLNSLGIIRGGWGPYCSDLSKVERAQLNAREKTKIDVEYKKLLAKKEEDCGILGAWRWSHVFEWLNVLLPLNMLISYRHRLSTWLDDKEMIEMI